VAKKAEINEKKLMLYRRFELMISRLNSFHQYRRVTATGAEWELECYFIFSCTKEKFALYIYHDDYKKHLKFMRSVILSSF
jgi:hypothetical protein